MNILRIIWFVLFFSLLFSCQQENTYIYEVNTIDIEQNNAGKTKEKSTEQFLNIAYANLYQTALSPSELVQMSHVVASIGDKQVAFETVIAKMMADDAVILPTNTAMRADLGQFIRDTYKRFYVRLPTEAEKTWWVNYLETHTNLTAENVYFSFATSDEYYYY